MRSPERLEELAGLMSGPLEHYLKWKEIVERFERGKHTTWSKCFLNAQGDTVKEREAKAYADMEYERYLEEWHEAAKKMISARVAYDNLKNQFDAIQSGLAFDRAHMSRLGG